MIENYIINDLDHIVDPARWVQDCFRVVLDDWQVAALRSNAKQSLWNIHRQSGKSTVAAWKALHLAIYRAESLILMVSPSERQSSELYRKFNAFYDLLEAPPAMTEDRSLSCVLANGSRVVALPGIEDTIRSFSNVALIIEDEASRVPDDLYAAVRPMLAISQGSIILMSTPNGRISHFWKTWDDNVDLATFKAKAGSAWEIVRVKADQCKRISHAWLENEKLNMDLNKYRQEFECEFCDVEGAVFDTDLFKSLINPNIQAIDLKSL